MRNRLLLFFAAFLINPAPFAQYETSEVSGSVRDISDSVISKAKITLTSERTGSALETETGENGNYDFPNVRAGVYKLTVRHDDFSSFTTELRVDVDISTIQIIDAELRPSPGQTGESAAALARNY